MTTGNLHVLVIEEHAENHEFLMTACRRHQLACTIDPCPIEAGPLALVAAQRDHRIPHLVILDLDQPHVSGVAILRQIREDPTLRAIVIIVLSGSLMPEDRAACAGADRFFIRPASFDGWINIVLFISGYAQRKEPAMVDRLVGTPSPATAPHLLHVEDEPDDRVLFARAFAKSGVHGLLRQVDSVSEALLFLNRLAPYQRAERPALIVLDLGLPRVDGRELLRLLRGNTRFRYIPIIVLTGSESYGDIERCRDLLVEDYVIKPKTLQELNEFIASLSRWLAEAKESAPLSRNDP